MPDFTDEDEFPVVLIGLEDRSFMIWWDVDSTIASLSLLLIVRWNHESLPSDEVEDSSLIKGIVNSDY